MVRFFAVFHWCRDRRLHESKGIVRSIRGWFKNKWPERCLGPLGCSLPSEGREPLNRLLYKQLGLKLDMQNLPAFGQVSVGNLKLILSGPGASGSRPMPDARQQEPGGWNRIVLQVKDLLARIEELKKAGLHFRNEMEVGPGGKQILLEDPDGNPIELFDQLASLHLQPPITCVKRSSDPKNTKLPVGRLMPLQVLLTQLSERSKPWSCQTSRHHAQP